jgi:flagellar secretion chaperone FliS
MFSSAFSGHSARANGFANVYRQVGVETGVSAATPHRLVQMLLDGCLESISLARNAMVEGNVDVKGREIGRAVRILEEGLKASLDMNRGGALAGNLRDLYAYTVVRLTQANLRNDVAGLEESSRLLTPLREAWTRIGERVPN